MQRTRMLYQSSRPEMLVACPSVVSVEMQSRYFGSKNDKYFAEDAVCGLKEEEELRK